MAVTTAATGRTDLARNRRHSSGRSDKSGGCEGGRSRHDNMGRLPRRSIDKPRLEKEVTSA